MPGHDLPGLDERLRQLPAALAVGAPAGLAERIAAAAGCAAPAPPRPSRPCSPGPS